jgi:hypothetical protein
MKIRKTIIALTILHEADEKVEGLGLEHIAHQINEGGWLGGSAILSAEDLDPDKVSLECKALGNDGSFFGYMDDNEVAP